MATQLSSYKEMHIYTEPKNIPKRDNEFFVILQVQITDTLFSLTTLLSFSLFYCVCLPLQMNYRLAFPFPSREEDHLGSQPPAIHAAQELPSAHHLFGKCRAAAALTLLLSNIQYMLPPVSSCQMFCKEQETLKGFLTSQPLDASDDYKAFPCSTEKLSLPHMCGLEKQGLATIVA